MLVDKNGLTIKADNDHICPECDGENTSVESEEGNEQLVACADCHAAWSVTYN